MARAFSDEFFDYYEAVFAPRDARVRYLFVLQSEELTLKLDGAGLHFGADAFENINEAFALAYAYPPDAMPGWARGCVGYQIFPDRFRREGETEEGLEPWGSDRVQSQFRFGGNLQGVLAAVPYLKELGVTMIYMTPIFLSDSAHRYNTFDYLKIDPLLGTEADLKALSDTLHQNNMRIVLDGVFNHCGLQFAPFVDAREQGGGSDYRDWFFFDEAIPCGYHTFSHEPYMPKLNLQNQACAEYFLGVGRYWMERCHIDGWRMDVSPEVWPDFWRKFRGMMKGVNPDSLMVAECWDDSREWITQGDMFDSTMHYVFCRSLWNHFATRSLSPERFDWAVNRETMSYPHRNQEVLWTFLGSHDTERFRTRAGGDERMLRAASFFQFTYLGLPIIYYGDELGMEGGADPDCRRPMRWNNVENNLTHQHFQKLARLRKGSEALRYGAFRTHGVWSNGLYAYLRATEGQQLLCVLNTSPVPAGGRVKLPGPMAGLAVVHDLYGERCVPVTDGGIQVSLDAGEGMILE
jgi:glycosidase